MITPAERAIRRLIDISASQGHIVPTAIAYHGAFYVGNLNPFPIVAGSSKIYKVTLGGQISIVAEGLTTVLGVTFDHLRTDVRPGEHDGQSVSHARHRTGRPGEGIG